MPDDEMADLCIGERKKTLRKINILLGALFEMNPELDMMEFERLIGEMKELINALQDQTQKLNAMSSLKPSQVEQIELQEQKWRETLARIKEFKVSLEEKTNSWGKLLREGAEQRRIRDAYQI